MSVDLGTGTTLHASGKHPDVSDKLNRRVRLGEIEAAVPLSILAEISSGPVNLLQSSSAIKSKTSSSVHRRPTGKLEGLRWG